MSIRSEFQTCHKNIIKPTYATWMAGIGSEKGYSDSRETKTNLELAPELFSLNLMTVLKRNLVNKKSFWSKLIPPFCKVIEKKVAFKFYYTLEII